MRGVAGVPLLLAAFVVHSVVSVTQPSSALFSSPMADGFVDFSPGQAGGVFSPLQETARESREEDTSEDGERPLEIFSDFFLGHHDLPVPRELQTVARLPETDVGASRFYDRDYLFHERQRGNRAYDALKVTRALPIKLQDPAKEPSSFYDNFYGKSFPGLPFEDQIRGTSGDFAGRRFRRSSDESKLIKKKNRSHFRVESALGDQKSEMGYKENSAISFASLHDDVSNKSSKPDVQERSFKEKSGNGYHSGEDLQHQSSSHRYGPIGLRRDEDDRPDYYFQKSTDVYHGTNEHQSRTPRDEFSSIHPQETGFHKFSFYESVDDFNKDFISTHPQNSHGPSDHLRSPYTQSEFKNAVEHKPPVKAQQYFEHGDSDININHESYSFSDPHPTDIVTKSPYSPHASSGTNDEQKIRYHDDKERTKDPHVTYLGDSPYVTDRHPIGKGEPHAVSGEKENYYHSDGSTIYSAKKSIHNGHSSNTPHEYYGGDNQNNDHHDSRGGRDHDDRHSDSSHVYHDDDRHSDSSHDYHEGDYDGRHSFRGDKSHVSYSGNDQHGHHNAISHQRFNNGDHKGIGYEDGRRGSHGSYSPRFHSDGHPHNKRAPHTTSSHPNHSLETSGGHSDFGPSHSGQNVHPSNFDRSPFRPSHELSSEHGHGGGFSLYGNNAGGRAQDHHNRVIEGTHTPSHFTPGVSAPLNKGGDFFHVEENIADLPEFLGAGSHETDSQKFRNNKNFVPKNNVVTSFNPVQFTESSFRSPYTHEKRHTASYREEKPFGLHENSLYSPDPSAFERVRPHNSFKPVKGKHHRTQQHHPRGQGVRATFRSNPLEFNRPVRPRARPPHGLPSSRGSGPPMGSSLMQFLRNLPPVNWSGRPTYRTAPNSFYR